MDIYNAFLSSFTSKPHIHKYAAPEQLLGRIYQYATPADSFLSLLAGGSVNAFSPLSYNISGLSCYMILYTRSGKGSFSCSHETLALAENSLLFFDCNQPFQLNISASSWSFYIGYLSGSALASYYDYFREASGSYLCQIGSASGVPLYLERLAAYTTIDTPADILGVSKWLTDLLTEICVAALNQERPDEYIPAYMLEMKQLLDMDYKLNFSLSDFEDRFRISKYRLCREFSRYFNDSPLQYLNARRIEAAKDLLLTTDMPVHEVGSVVGIDNTNHFIHLFKKFTGTTPFVFKQGAPATIRELHFPYKPGCPLQ